MRGGAAVLWSSKHLNCPTSSSTEAEYRAGSECVKQIVWAQELLKELSLDTSLPTKLQIDNQSAIRMSMSVASQHKTQHIRCNEMLLNEYFERGDVYPEWVDTKENPADALTKALPKLPFQKHRNTLLGTHLTSPSQFVKSKKLLWCASTFGV